MQEKKKFVECGQNLFNDYLQRGFSKKTALRLTLSELFDRILAPKAYLLKNTFQKCY